ncbi:hypothetical protein Tco_0810534 [Tanacetum coccineum]
MPPTSLVPPAMLDTTTTTIRSPARQGMWEVKCRQVIPLPLTGIDRKIKGGTRNQRKVKKELEQDTKGKEKAYQAITRAEEANWLGTEKAQSIKEYEAGKARQRQRNAYKKSRLMGKRAKGTYRLKEINTT